MNCSMRRTMSTLLLYRFHGHLKSPRFAAFRRFRRIRLRSASYRSIPPGVINQRRCRASFWRFWVIVKFPSFRRLKCLVAHLRDYRHAEFAGCGAKWHSTGIADISGMRFKLWVIHSVDTKSAPDSRRLVIISSASGMNCLHTRSTSERNSGKVLICRCTSRRQSINANLSRSLISRSLILCASLWS